LHSLQKPVAVLGVLFVLGYSYIHRHLQKNASTSDGV
jgi:hypothetical protein